MSLECSECERDLRGGHDPGCSRSPGWIKCGLPWTYYGDWEDAPQSPSFKKEVKKQFGKTEEQAYKELLKVTGKGAKKAQKEYRDFCQKVREWTKNQPAWVDYQEALAAWNKEESQKSFCGKKLNIPGTLVEIQDGKVLKQFLIGDINTIGGVCDDCMGFGKDAVVVKYKVLHERTDDEWDV